MITAFQAEEPESGLGAAIGVLEAHGLAGGSGEPWLSLTVGARTLELSAVEGADPPDPPVIAALLRVALARAVEHAEHLELRERFDLLSDAAIEGILVHDSGVVVEVNQRMCEMLGRSRAEMFRADSIVTGVAPEDLPAALARIRDRVEGDFTLTMVHKDGTRIRTEFRTKQGKLGARPVRVVSLRDVTERERTAALLRESENRLRSMIEATFDAVVLTRGGIVVEASPASERLLGRTREEILGRSVLDFVAPSARTEVSSRIQDQFSGTYETVAMTAQGESIPVETISLLSTLDGEPVRVAGLRDLRAARRLEQERRTLELQVERTHRLESLGVLAGGVAHDFNNLLIGVLGNAELLLERLTDPDDREMVEAIGLAGKRAASLTQQMLGYARRGDVHHPEPVDLSELVHELHGLIDAALSKKAQVVLDLEPGAVALGDRAKLMQVLMNLLTNASDALAGGAGTITVTTRKVRRPDIRWDEALGATVGPGDWVLVEVRDTGTGMDDATRQRVFEPFFTTKPRGHGLGLGSCLGTVAAHRGAMLVESGPGRGSTFSVLLPATRPARVVATQPPTEPAARPCRVLVVDDEPMVRGHLRRVLELRGFLVDEAPNGRSGLAAVARVAPDLVVLDLNMPDLDGVETVRQLRVSGSTVPVILCSGNIGEADDRGLEPGLVQGFLQKPFGAQELIALIGRVRA